MPPNARTLLTALRRSAIVQPPRRTLVAAPSPGSAPLLERRADRALPEIRKLPSNLYLTVPLFLLAITASGAVIFNYQKSSSSVVASTLYSVRKHAQARELLGTEIQFASKMPWIGGELNQFGGRIDVNYRVKGLKQGGRVRFKATREGRRGYFTTEIWELRTDDGTCVDMLSHAPVLGEAA